jgi:hypothetical protein
MRTISGFTSRTPSMRRYTYRSLNELSLAPNPVTSPSFRHAMATRQQHRRLMVSDDSDRVVRPVSAPRGFPYGTIRCFALPCGVHRMSVTPLPVCLDGPALGGNPRTVVLLFALAVDRWSPGPRLSCRGFPSCRFAIRLSAGSPRFRCGTSPFGFTRYDHSRFTRHLTDRSGVPSAG